MNDLTQQDVVKLSELVTKIRNQNTHSSELEQFFNLIKKSGDYNQNQLMGYLTQVGFNSENDFIKHLNERRKDELLQGLVLIGTAILAFYVIAQLSKK